GGADRNHLDRQPLALRQVWHGRLEHAVLRRDQEATADAVARDHLVSLAEFRGVPGDDRLGAFALDPDVLRRPDARVGRGEAGDGDVGAWVAVLVDLRHDLALDARALGRREVHLPAPADADRPERL